MSFQATSPETLGDHLRYIPDKADFVSASDDKERFNRPLYGGNTAFRVDGGDLPEFVLYLPGRGGNIRFAVRVGDIVKWLHEADQIECRYRPGSLSYKISDPVFKSGSIELEAIGSYEKEGFLIKCVTRNCPPDLTLISVYGGLNGQRGKRDGDIGTEAVPISEWFQLKPEFCDENRFTIQPGNQRFQLDHPKAIILGTISAPCKLEVRDASCWEDPALLLSIHSGSTPQQPVVVCSVQSIDGEPTYYSWEKHTDSTADTSELADYLEVRKPLEDTPIQASGKIFQLWAPETLCSQFATAAKTREQRAGKLSIHTPDPYLNAATTALCIGADATWDEAQQAVMHGAIAWRSKLLGWRGPYAMDALGWHERARQHLEYWAQQQDLSPIPDVFPGADEKSNLARAEAALHSNGALSHSHYDMNLVYIDALLRHLRWTGDLEFARSVWPVIKRHLAWEQRLFRRVYEKESQSFPLYEAYAAIWASDELGYNGGGVAYTSAYNAFHQREAANIARLLGEDPTPYKLEAEAIEKAMHKLLWVESETEGHFAEYRDWLGLQRLHPSAGVWSVYHPIDCEIIAPEDAYRMTQYVDQHIPSHTILYPEIPDDKNLRVYASSHWFPYHWSVNNVVMGENLHTALAYWQAGRPASAFSIAKGAILASMFAGICPGNVGSMNYLDAYRGESQRDFADGAGVMSRMLVEGLFGIQPDLLKNELTIRPGFPSTWEFAEIEHDSISLAYSKSANNQHLLSIQPNFNHPVALILKLPLSVLKSSIRINEKHPDSIITIGEAPWGYFECRAQSSDHYSVYYKTDVWETATQDSFAPFAYKPTTTVTPIDWNKQINPNHCIPVKLDPYFNAKVTDIFKQDYLTPRSPFTSLSMPKQGIGGWAGAYNTHYEVDDSGLRLKSRLNEDVLLLPNGAKFQTPGSVESKNIIYVSKWDNFPDEVSVPLSSSVTARRAYLLLAGSTNWMQSQIDNGQITFQYSDGSSDVLMLQNPTTWWPIDQDYYIDDFQFQFKGSFPLRLDLKTGLFREISSSATIRDARSVEGGAATVLTFPLHSEKALQSIRLTALSNEVVIGLLAITLEP